MGSHAVVRVGGREMAYEDFGGDGPVLLAVHGSFGRGAIFGGPAERLAGRARVIAPDQRGHGHSEHGGGGSRKDFVGDLALFVNELGLGPVVVLGHSLGGINAYQLAAWHPELVAALIVEDVGPVMRTPEVEHPVLDVRGWPREAATRAQLAAAIEARGVPDSAYFLRSAEQDPRSGRWRLLFDWEEMMSVQEGGVGDWWQDWLASACPALVLHGHGSTLLPTPLAREMTQRRPGTRLVEFPDAGHWIHDDDPDGFARAVGEFLDGLRAG